MTKTISFRPDHDDIKNLSSIKAKLLTKSDSVALRYALSFSVSAAMAPAAVVSIAKPEWPKLFDTIPMFCPKHKQNMRVGDGYTCKCRIADLVTLKA